MPTDRYALSVCFLSLFVGFVFGAVVMVKATSDICVPKESLIESKRCTYSVDLITGKVVLIWADTGEPVVKP